MITRFLMLPGWKNSDPEHWQSLWESLPNAQRVVQHDWAHPLRGDWITRLEDHVLSCQTTAGTASPPSCDATDIVLVAHSLGCHLVAAWAALSQQVGRIRGALLVAPPDVTQPDFPAAMHSWRRAVLKPLPFPSVCVISSNDPFCALDQAEHMAKAWGSEVVHMGRCGHINTDSGLGDWPQGRGLLSQLAAHKPPPRLAANLQ